MNQRDVVLVPFPFSDQSGQKIRPALIISNDDYNKISNDVIICAITTNTKQSKYSIIIDQKDLDNGLLHEKSSIKVENILRLNKSLIIKVIATINTTTFSRVRSVISELF